MTTVIFKEDIKGIAKTYETIADFLNIVDTNTIYEEYLERKLQEAKNASEDEFINL